jgi:hypothetical protein
MGLLSMLLLILMGRLAYADAGGLSSPKTESESAQAG